MKKVLHISNYYTPHIGGIESTCQYLAEGLKGEYDVRVICFSEDNRTKYEETNGIKIIKPAVILNIARQGLSLNYYFELRKLLKDWKPDIIHIHYPNPFVTALLLPLISKKCKLYVHWHLDITKQKNIYPFIKPFETALLKRADMIGCTSPLYRDSSTPLVTFLDKVEILQSAIDTTRFQLSKEDELKVEALKEKYGNKKIVFYVGRHVPHKGPGILVEAEKLIKNDCVVLIGGSGPITQEIKDACSSKRVHFVGRIPNELMKIYYHAADIFAFPSYTKAEAFGLTLCEAMYCYAVPVTFHIEGSGVNWVCINNETGIEVPNLDVNKYAEAIDKLLQNSELLHEMAIAGHNRVIENFSVDEEVKLLKNQYDRLLK